MLWILLDVGIALLALVVLAVVLLALYRKLKGLTRALAAAGEQAATASDALARLQQTREQAAHAQDPAAQRLEQEDVGSRA